MALDTPANLNYKKMTKIKICGITNVDDALAAAEYGADAIGFVFVPNTPRYIDPQRASEIVEALPPFLTRVGLFSDPTISEVEMIAKECNLDALQFHGYETPDFCGSFYQRVIKAFRVKDQSTISLLKEYQVSAYLLDSYTKGIKGGSGMTFDWNLAIAAKKYGRIILAGGLNPQNVSEAVQQVSPYGVDISSGVEQKPGKKDYKKIKDFIDAVRSAERR